MAVLDDDTDKTIKIYAQRKAYAEKEVMIGTSRADDDGAPGVRLLSLVTDITADSPTEKAYVDGLGNVVATSFATADGTLSVSGITYMFSAGPSDETDRTTALNTALASGGHIYLGAGQYMVSGPVDLKNYTRLTLHPKAVIKRSASMPVQTGALRIQLGVHDVIIEGGKLDGNKDTLGPGGVGGECTGIQTDSGSKVTIRDMEIVDWPADVTGGRYGYGIYFGGQITKAYVNNVNISGCEQNDMFIVGCTDCVVENSIFEDAEGSSPGSGLNCEPNTANSNIKGLVVKNCTFKRNNYGVTCNNHYSGDWHDILFDGCLFENNRAGGIGTTGGGLAVGLKMVNCTARNNYGDVGFYIGHAGFTLIDCHSIGHEDHGFEFVDPINFSIIGCTATNNVGVGFTFDMTGERQLKGSVIGCSAFNNESLGFRVSSSVPLATQHAGMHFDACKTGNDINTDYPAWTAATNVTVGYRAQNDSGKVYEVVSISGDGTTAGSGGPTGTGSNIADNLVHWDYMFPIPQTDWGFEVYGECARGTQFSGCDDYGSLLGHYHEQPAGDANTIGTVDVLETQWSGQKAFVLNRIRGTAFDDQSGSPGDVSGYRGSGVAAIAAARVDLAFDGQTVNFSNTEVVTGGTSGATGTVASQTDAGATGTLRLTGVTGTFVDNEAITGSIAGAAVVNGYPRAVCNITTPYAAVGDAVVVQPMQIDATLTGVVARVLSAGNVLIEGRGAATATYKFFWEIIKKGTFTNDF